MRPDYDPLPEGLDRETRLEAKEVLDEVLTWRRSPQGWATVSGALEELAAAVEAGNQQAARDVLLTLAGLSTVRTGRVGDAGTQAAPEQLIELATLLQYAVGRAARSAPVPEPQRAGEAPPDFDHA